MLNKIRRIFKIFTGRRDITMLSSAIVLLFAAMLNPSIPRMTIAALETVEYGIYVLVKVDVIFLDQSCKKLQDNSVQDAFTELKQVNWLIITFSLLNSVKVKNMTIF